MRGWTVGPAPSRTERRMEGSDRPEARQATEGADALDEALARECQPLARFAEASAGTAAGAAQIVEQVFAQADGARSGADADSFARARLFGAARKKVAHLVEQR